MDKGMSTQFTRRDFLKSALIMTSLGSGMLLVSACGGAGGAAPTTAAGSGKTVNLTLNGDDKVEFSTKTLQVEAGSTVALTFSNKSTDKLMNWVLAKPGQMLRVVTQGVVAGESAGYLQQDDSNVIVHTKLLKAGESETVTFPAPAPGDYQYFCTFPGYYTRMNGILTVK
jgi:azurin